MKKLNVEEVRREYMTSDISFAELARRFGVATSSISRMAKREGWEEQRNEKQRRTTERRIKKLDEQQEDAWEYTKTTMLRILKKKMEELENGTCDLSYKQMSSAIKDLKDIGMFGMTMADKKALAEIQRIEKELTDDGSKDITVKVVMPEEEYAD